jgi:hypothetical protein
MQQPFQHDMTTLNTVRQLQKFDALVSPSWIAHPPYSPDLAPSNFKLFPYMKNDLRGYHTA